MRAYDVIQKAASYIGVREKYNNDVLFNTAYYGRPVNGASYPWCCAFIWYVFHLLDPTDRVFPKTASCPAAMIWFAGKGQLHTHGPLPGDVVFYDFNGRGIAGHIGIVQSVGDGYVVAIEGNTGKGDPTNGGCVMERKRALSCCLAFGRPEYVETMPVADTTGYPTIRQGASGAWVQLLQNALTVRGYAVSTDGEFGPQTEHKVRAFQRAACIEVDGIVGPQTWRSLFS